MTVRARPALQLFFDAMTTCAMPGCRRKPRALTGGVGGSHPDSVYCDRHHHAT